MKLKINSLFSLTILLFINSSVNGQIDGIKVNGDACSSLSLKFSVTGTTSSPFISWKFGDPASGTNDTTTIFGDANSVPNPTHTFSGPGVYDVCAYYREPGKPPDSVCRNFQIGICCNGVILCKDSCAKNVIPFMLETGASFSNIAWNFGDPSSKNRNTGVGQSVYHVFLSPGLYTVTATVNASCGNFKVSYVVKATSCEVVPACNAVIAGSDSCLENGSTFSVNTNANIRNILWNFDDTASGNNTDTGFAVSHKFSRIGVFTVQATVETPCGTVRPAFLAHIVNCQPSPNCIGTISSSISQGGCVLNPIQFNVESNFTYTDIQWNFGDPASGILNESNSRDGNHVFTSSGTFYVQAIVNFSCGTDTITKSIFIKNCPGICYGNILSFDSCFERTTSFGISADSAINYVSWNFGDAASGANNESTSLNPSHQFSAPGNYSVQAIISFKCGQYTAKANIPLKSCTLPLCTPSLANAFSPNGDGINDQLAPFLNCVLDVYEWNILDRWGQTVFITKNSFEKWDGKWKGKSLPAGIYYYFLTYKLSGQPPVKKSGSILLIR